MGGIAAGRHSIIIIVLKQVIRIFVMTLAIPPRQVRGVSHPLSFSKPPTVLDVIASLRWPAALWAQVALLCSLLMR